MIQTKDSKEHIVELFSTALDDAKHLWKKRASVLGMTFHSKDGEVVREELNIALEMMKAMLK